MEYPILRQHCPKSETSKEEITNDKPCMKLQSLRLNNNQIIARDLWEANHSNWKNKEAWHFGMGETSWSREVTEQNSSSSVTLPQVTSPSSWPPSGSNGVSPSFDSTGSCTPAEAWHGKAAVCWGPHLGPPVWAQGTCCTCHGLRGEARVQVTHKASTLATPADTSLHVHNKNMAVCMQLEPLGAIGWHLEMCRGTLTFCTCTVSCFICCIDVKYIVYPTGLWITQKSKINKPLWLGLT